MLKLSCPVISINNEEAIFFVIFSSLYLMTIYNIFAAHGGSVVSTIALKRWGAGFKSDQEQHLHVVCMSFVCLLGTLVSSHTLKTC